MTDTIWAERELTGPTVTLRAELAELSDGTAYSCLALEPTDGKLRQLVMKMTRADWIALADIAEAMVRAEDRRAAARGEVAA